MNRIDSFETFNSLIRSFKENRETVEHFPFNKNVFEKYINDRRLFYEEDAQGLYFCVDEDLFHDLYYIIEKGSSLSIDHKEKALLINENQLLKDSISFNDLYLNSGFEVSAVNHQLTINIEPEKERIHQKYKEAQEFLKKHAYAIEENRHEYDKEVKRLWTENLKKTDVPYDHYAEGNTLLLLDQNEKLLAAAWYSSSNGRDSEWRHIVVDQPYRGKGLSNVLAYHWLHLCVENRIRRGLTWVEENNIISMKAHQKIGFAENKRLSIQYIMEAGE